MIDLVISALARRLLAWLAARTRGPRREWLEAMLAELDAIPGGGRRLIWALGGLRVALTPGRGAPSTGSAAFAAGAAAAVVAGMTVVALRMLLEDSPYAFNLGAGAPAGIHPDAGNPLSLAWDGVVLGSVAAFAAMGAVAVFFLRLAVVPRDADRQGRRRALGAALLAAAACLWVVAAACVTWGVAAHAGAGAIFDHAPRGGLYLTRGPWVAVTTTLCLCAAVATAAGLGATIPAGSGQPVRPAP